MLDCGDGVRHPPTIDGGRMKRVVGVRFKTAGKVYYFDPGELEICEKDGVIVETARGIEFGDVVEGIHEVPDEMVVNPLKDVLRVATEQDWEVRERNRAKEKEAFEICMAKIAEHQMDMKLVDVEYAFNASKILFYFTAEGRVDFRELVKELASVFKTRIELRQIGVRDEAKMLGGLGSCGRPVCCKSFLADFQPVSIKMAKEQNLSLSPTKISGLCGRLMCCLKYEQDCYESMRKLMPKVNKDVMTPDGRGQVLENNVITERTRVRVTLDDGTFDVRSYPFRELNRAEDLPVNEQIAPKENGQSENGAEGVSPQAGGAPRERSGSDGRRNEDRRLDRTKQRHTQPKVPMNHKIATPPIQGQGVHPTDAGAVEQKPTASSGQNRRRRPRRKPKSAGASVPPNTNNS